MKNKIDKKSESNGKKVLKIAQRFKMENAAMDSIAITSTNTLRALKVLQTIMC